MNNLWWKLFWRTALRIVVAGFALGGLYFPVTFTFILIFGLLFNYPAYENLGLPLGFYVVVVLISGGLGCIFGVILGVIEGIIQGIATLTIVRFFFFPPHDEIQLKYSLTISSLVISLIVSYLYFTKYLPGMSGAMLIIPLIITVSANVWIVRRIGEWYLSELALSLPIELQRADAGDEP